jgi:DNA-binding phage protein
MNDMAVTPTTEMEMFSSRVLDEIRAQDTSVAAIARECGMTREGLSALLHGRGGDCKISTGCKIANALGKHISELLRPE